MRLNLRLPKFFGGVFAILGVVTSILVLASLTQRWGDIYLAEEFDRTLKYYRGWMGQLKWLIFDWWTIRFWPDFSLPMWVMDVVALCILSIGAIFRQAWIVHEIVSKNTPLRKMLTPDQLKQFDKSNDMLFLENHWKDVILGPLAVLRSVVGQIAYLHRNFSHRSKIRRSSTLSELEQEHLLNFSRVNMQGRIGGFVALFLIFLGTALFFWMNAVVLGSN